MSILQCLDYTRFQLAGADVSITAVMVVAVGTVVQLSWSLSEKYHYNWYESPSTLTIIEAYIPCIILDGTLY